jgi:hypothetical protein
VRSRQYFEWAITQANRRRSLQQSRLVSVVGVQTQRHRQSRGRYDHARETDDRDNADQHINDLVDRRARVQSGIGTLSESGNSGTDRDQCAQADERERPAVEFLGLRADFVDDIRGNAWIILSHSAQSFRVVHDGHLSAPAASRAIAAPSTDRTPPATDLVVKSASWRDCPRTSRNVHHTDDVNRRALLRLESLHITSRYCRSETVFA